MRQWLRHKSIRTQVFSLMILMVTVPLMLVSVMTYYVSSEKVKSEFQSSSELILNNLSFNIDQYLQSIENGTLLAYTDSNLKSALEEVELQPHDPLTLERQSIIEHFVKSTELMIKNVNGVQIFSGKHVYYAGGVDLVGADYDYTYQDADWYKKTVAAKGKTVLFSTHKPFQRKFSNDEVISLARVIRPAETDTILGVLLLDIRLEQIKQILALSENSKRSYILVDEVGKVIYASNTFKPMQQLDLEPSTLNLILSQNNGAITTQINKEDVYVNFLTSHYSGWKVIQYISSKDLVQQSSDLEKMIFLFALGSAGVAVIFMFFISRRVTGPIVLLNRQVQMIGKGDLERDIYSQREDEIGNLFRGVRKMQDDLKNFIQRVTMANRMQKEAQFNALQSQINPHFLYNTLESIQMKAILNDQRELAEMIGALGHLFKIHTKTGHKMVPLQKELEHIRLYLKIQNMRYDNRFDYIEDIEDSCKQLSVLRFILQPFIENAVMYGFQGYEQGEIYLKVYKEGEKLYIVIRDNGRGMSPDKLQAVRDRLGQDPSEGNGEHIGLNNVHNRIQLYFGEQYGIQLESELGKGTVVYVNLPIVQGEALDSIQRLMQ